MITGTCLRFLALDSSNGQVLLLFVSFLVSHKTSLLQQLTLQALGFCFGFWVLMVLKLFAKSMWKLVLLTQFDSHGCISVANPVSVENPMSTCLQLVTVSLYLLACFPLLLLILWHFSQLGCLGS